MLMSGGDVAVFVRGPITWAFWTFSLIAIAAIYKSVRTAKTA